MSDWKSHGACRNMDTAIFYPDAQDEHEIALDVCATCPVIEQCRDYALRNEKFGVWGGTTASQRRRMRDQRHIKLERLTALPRARGRPPEAVALSKVV